MPPRLPTGRAFANAYNAAHDAYKARLRRAGLVPGQHFDHALSYSETVLADTPRLYWRLGETTGQAQDSSGNGLHATDTFGYAEADRSVPGPLLNETTTCFRSNGTTRYVVRSGLTSQALNIDGLKPRTVEAWINTASLGITFVGVWEVGAKVNGQYMALGVSDNETTYHINLYGPNVPFTGLGFGQWQLIHVIHDPGSATPLQVYRNGTQVLTSATAINLGNTWPFMVGLLDNRYFDGLIAEVAVYDKVLSPSRISAHYEAAGYGG